MNKMNKTITAVLISTAIGSANAFWGDTALTPLQSLQVKEFIQTKLHMNKMGMKLDSLGSMVQDLQDEKAMRVYARNARVDESHSEIMFRKALKRAKYEDN